VHPPAAGLRPAPVASATFAPDGARIATASSDGSARVWAADGTAEPIILNGSGGSVTAVAFSPDGGRIVAASADGSAKIWRISWDELVRYLRSATTICLTEQERVTLLQEGPGEARRRYEACERSHDRTPYSRDSLLTR
jgi:WD40 repeat protein